MTKTRGIVLQTVKYGENSLIASIYTEKSGRQSFWVNATHGLKSVNKAALMQPLFLLELDAYQKQTREIQRIKELRIFKPYVSIPFNILKSTQVIFLAEVLNKILQEEEGNPDLYRFLENALIYFDLMEEGSVNFYLWLLTRITEFLGIMPLAGEISDGWFDMKKGTMVSREPLQPVYMNRDTTRLFHELLIMKIDGLSEFKITRKQREILISKILDYLHTHFESLGTVRSLNVLKEVFS